MKSLDQAVQKFKILKQKLKSISEQPSKTTKVYLNSINSNTQPLVKPLYSSKLEMNKKNSNLTHHQESYSDKQNNLSLQNKMRGDTKQKNQVKDKENRKIRERIQKQKLYKKQNQKQVELTIDNDYSFEADDPKNLTKKKCQHKKNNSWNCANKSNKNSEIYHDGFEDKAALNNSFRITSLNNSRTSQNHTVELKNKERTLSEINSLLEKKKEVLQAIQRKMGPSFLEESKLQIIMRSKRAIKAPNLFQMQVQGRKRSKSKPLTIRWK